MPKPVIARFNNEYVRVPIDLRISHLPGYPYRTGAPKPVGVPTEWVSQFRRWVSQFRPVGVSIQTRRRRPVSRGVICYDAAVSRVIRNEAMSDTFAFLRLTARQGDWEGVHAALTSQLQPPSIWGAFYGLFGVGSNELIAVTVGDDDAVTASIETARILEPVDRVDALTLTPTVRPTSAAPLTREGLYVFRFLDVANADVEEIASLSAQAWRTFESSGDYRAKAQGLFCQRDRSDVRGRMLLLTWYDGLNSWQTSRQPPAEAGSLFQRRRKLTSGTIAYATRLVT